MSIKKIMIVEDEMILTMLNKQFVQELGHQVVKAVKTGKEAIEFVKENDVDVILMDVRLKDKQDGIETMTEINKTKNIPVVYITGNSDPITIERAQKTNMLAFCVKPINLEELERIIGRATDK